MACLSNYALGFSLIICLLILRTEHCGQLFHRVAGGQSQLNGIWHIHFPWHRKVVSPYSTNIKSMTSSIRRICLIYKIIQFIERIWKTASLRQWKVGDIWFWFHWITIRKILNFSALSGLVKEWCSNIFLCIPMSPAMHLQ